MEQLNRLSGIAHWLPRFSLASIFIYHGLPKIALTADVAGMMGMPFILVLMIGLVEVGGSLLIIWGGFGPDWATRVSGLLFTAVMIGAIVLVHAQYGWNSINMGNNGGRGMEFQVLIIAVSLLYVFKGNTLGQKVEVNPTP
ncbi:MAG: DoxX family protein [Balneolaceae bacterium]|nr:DoxX family protein [Balneolaceae bacterium]